VVNNMYRFRYITFKKIVDIALETIKNSTETDMEARKGLILKELIKLVFE